VTCRLGANDAIFLALRIGVVVCLYGFLAAILLVVLRDLRREPPPATAARVRQRGRLIVVGGGSRTGAEFPLADVTTIGRDATCTIVLDDDYASARHAAIVWRDGQLVLSDLDSTNGTMVNDAPIAEPVQLKLGDLIRIGSHRLKVARPSK
jgi:hypothetical protein